MIVIPDDRRGKGEGRLGFETERRGGDSKRLRLRRAHYDKGESVIESRKSREDRKPWTGQVSRVNRVCVVGKEEVRNSQKKKMRRKKDAAQTRGPC
jgi:hypothetical protein